MSTHLINETLTLTQVHEIISQNKQLTLSESSKQKILKCNAYLKNKLEHNEAPIYGINTGFGSLCNTEINKSDLEQLQYNLVRSHACGTGPLVPTEIVKIMLLLKIQGLSYGHSGVQLSTVEQLIHLFNHNILPVVYTQGSLGASGDLAPLAHLSLPLIGEGEVWYNNAVVKTEALVEQGVLSPVSLGPKEGLALLNGTQFMSAYGVSILLKAKHLEKAALNIAAASLDGYDGRIEPFNPLIQQVRAHKGQIAIAEQMRTILADSALLASSKKYVQDPYSFRCIPQVHGASHDVINRVTETFETEINSVTDNPTIFPDEDLIISAGNFHGQHLAVNFDYLSIALAELASISERRTYKLISGTRDLPAFLVANPGLNSGFMIAQYTAASIVSKNKQLCTPSSVDTIDSSNGQEDHVSMGANAAVRCYEVVNNLESVLGIELMNAMQALDFRTNTSSSTIETLRKAYREQVPFVENDVYLHPLIEKSKQFIATYNF